MKIDCSEPEQCDYVFVTQESEPSSVIASSVTSMPDSSQPVEALGHDSAAIVSTSTSSPVQSSSPNRSGAPTPPVTTSVSSEPAQAPGQNTFSLAAFLGSPTPSAFGRPVQAPAFDFGTMVSSATTQALGPTTSSEPAQASVTDIFGSGASAATIPSFFRPTQAFNFGSGASAASTSSTSSPFAAPSPFRCGSMEAPVQSSAPITSSLLFGFRQAQDFGNTAFPSPFDSGRPVAGISPPASNTATSTVLFGTTPVSVSSTLGPTQDFAKTGSVFASSTTPKNPFGSLFSKSDGNYSPGSHFNVFGPNPPPPTGFNATGNTAFTSPFDSGRPVAGISPPASYTATSIVLFGTTPVSVSSTLGPTQGVAKAGSVFASSTTPKNPSFNLFGPNPRPPTGFNAATMFPSSSSSLAATISSTERGSRYPRYEPTPTDDFSSGGHPKMMSISASDYYQHKSHEELRWEDYKRGDKGEVRSSPADQIPPTFSRPSAFFSQPTVPPSIFASPRIPDHHQQGTTQGNMTGFPAAVQRPHETAGVSSPASGCTACGATSSSSASGHLGFNAATNPPSAATSLPGSLFFTQNLAAQGTITTPAAVQANPTLFGTTYLAAQGAATRPALQPYPMMFGTTYLAAQGTTTTPAFQAYPMMFGASPAAQGTNLAVQWTTPAVQAYPVAGYVLLPFPTMNLQ